MSSVSAFESVEFRKLLGRFVDVCQAIEYAHSRGVLHRDLKPGNIMLGKYGETLVVDWGLAKLTGQDEPSQHLGETPLATSSESGSAATQFGCVIGTPAYMPPEQAAGNLDALGPASDVYSLGATLYYLLTGRAPIQGRAALEILQAVKTGSFPPPRAVNRAIPRSLEAICLRAMALRPAERYATPLELADDIERFLADEPVTAHREPLRARTGRWIRKHPRSVAAIATTLMAALTSATVISAVVAGKNSELVQANIKLIAARNQANEKQRVADRLRLVAERQTRAAEQAARRSDSSLSVLIESFDSTNPLISGSVEMSARDVRAIAS